MTWEQHRYAVERARDRMRKFADEANEASQGVNLQGEAASSDAEMLDEVADFLQSLEGYNPQQFGSRGYLEGDQLAEANARDWNRMISEISVCAAKFDLPAPDLVFHPRWHEVISRACRVPVLGTLIHRGVRARFGVWQQRDTLVL